MNYIEFYTDDDEVIEIADSYFDIATVVAPEEGGDWSQYKIAVYDKRSEQKLRRIVRKIFNGVEHNRIT